MSTGLDLDFSEDQGAICAAIERFCTRREVETIARQSGQSFPREAWRELAEIGVFYPAAPGHAAGGALEICAISETLGKFAFPGPLAATYIAIQVLDQDEAGGLLDGTQLVSLCAVGDTLLPYGTEADLFLIIDGNKLQLARAPGRVEPVATLGGETWGRAALEIETPLQPGEYALLVGNITTAAYLAGAAWELLMKASEHAATRKQFGKALGEFQAVTHPLADCAIGLTGARTMARAAACSLDESEYEEATQLAAGALLSARRTSLQTAFACHQVFAGIGVTLEGPAFHFSRRIRQVASSPPCGMREQDLLLAEAGLGA